MRPEEKDILLRIFRVQSVSELATIVHDSKKSVQYAIDNSTRTDVFSSSEKARFIHQFYFLLSVLTNLSGFIESSSLCTTSPNKPKNLVLIDDDELITYRVATIARTCGIEFSHYQNEADFLQVSSTIPKSCMILVDWHLEDVTAKELLFELERLDFTNVYLFTDSPDDFSRYPILEKLPKSTEWMKQWHS